jgi:ATP-dependent Clp protease ATP-binding subunit ClpC
MRRLEDSLAESILAGKVKDGDTVIVDVSEQNQVILKTTLQPDFAFIDR